MFDCSIVNALRGKNRTISRGFTLIELLIVIAVIGVLSAGVLTAINIAGQLIKANLSKAKTFAASVENSLGFDQVGKWSFDSLTAGVTGTTPDTSGYNNNGSCPSASCPTLQISAQCDLGFGGCLSFNGSSQYIDIADNSAFDVSNVTVSAWVKSNVTTNLLTAVSRLNQSSVGNGNWILGHGASSSTYRFVVVIGGSNYDVESGTNFSTGTWHHIVGIYNGSVVKLYVDGKEVGTPSNISGTLADNSVNVRIGNRFNSGLYHWNGLIDEVQIYKQALLSSQIQRLYAKGLVRRAIAYKL